MQPYDPDNEEFRRELGRTIRLLRIDQQVERQDLADAAGISYSYLSAIENGQKSPSFRLLYGLAERLGLRGDELLAVVRERLGAPPPGLAPAPAAPAAAPRPAERTRRLRPGRRAAPPAAPAAAQDPADADQVSELAGLLRRLSRDDARAVLDLARRLADRG